MLRSCTTEMKSSWHCSNRWNPEMLSSMKLLAASPTKRRLDWWKYPPNTMRLTVSWPPKEIQEELMSRDTGDIELTRQEVLRDINQFTSRYFTSNELPPPSPATPHSYTPTPATPDYDNHSLQDDSSSVGSSRIQQRKRQNQTQILEIIPEESDQSELQDLSMGILLFWAPITVLTYVLQRRTKRLHSRPRRRSLESETGAHHPQTRAMMQWWKWESRVRALIVM